LARILANCKKEKKKLENCKAVRKEGEKINDGFVKSRNFSIFVIPAFAEILMIQFILHWQFLLKPEIEFKIIEPWDRWFYPL
jgi:hypothetical protein